MKIDPQRACLERSLAGCLLGTAVGDALGLPGEGLSRVRLGKMLPPPDRHRFLFGRGMVSDDTEHACMTAQALVFSAGDPDLFARRLSRELRAWLLGLPAGTGLATLKAALRLCVGFSPNRSGVFSAGNGPAMRAPIIGVSYGGEPSRLLPLLQVSTRVTHTDPKAEYGALAIALAAHVSAQAGPTAPCLERYLNLLRQTLPADARPLAELAARAAASAECGEATECFASEIGCQKGVSGYIYATVPVVLHAWFAHPLDFRAAVSSAIRCGGDTDTTAAIVGGIVGAGVGKEGIPDGWLTGLAEWPRTTAWMAQLGTRLAEAIATGAALDPPRLSRPACLARNVLFVLTVVAHGLRRLLPPY